MYPFPKTTRALSQMRVNGALEVPSARRTVRKGAPRSSSASSVNRVPFLAGNFALIDVDGGTWIEESDEGIDQYGFPAATSETDAMFHYHVDVSNFAEARLLVTVAEAAESGIYLQVTSSQLGLDPLGLNLSHPLDEAGFHLSTWQTLTPDLTQYEEGSSLQWPFATIRWWVYNPTELPSSARIGLCQLQIRQAAV